MKNREKYRDNFLKVVKKGERLYIVRLTAQLACNDGA